MTDTNGHTTIVSLQGKQKTEAKDIKPLSSKKGKAYRKVLCCVLFNDFINSYILIWNVTRCEKLACVAICPQVTV